MSGSQEHYFDQVEEIKDSIDNFINSLAEQNKKVILIIDGLDRYNPFASDFLRKVINRRDKFEVYKCILCERIYSPTDDYNRSIKDDRIISQESGINYKYHIKYVLENADIA